MTSAYVSKEIHSHKKVNFLCFKNKRAGQAKSALFLFDFIF